MLCSALLSACSGPVVLDVELLVAGCTVAPVVAAVED